MKRSRVRRLWAVSVVSVALIAGVASCASQGSGSERVVRMEFRARNWSGLPQIFTVPGGVNIADTCVDLDETLETKVSVDLVSAPFGAVNALLRWEFAFELTMYDTDQEVGRPDYRTITLHMSRVKLRDAVTAICQQVDMDFAERNGKAYLCTPEITRQLRRAEEAHCLLYDEDAHQRVVSALEKTVSFDFHKAPLADVVAYLRQAAGVNIIMDDTLGGKERDISLKATNLRLRNALDWIARLVDLNYTVTDGSIFISTKQGLRERELVAPVICERAAWKTLERQLNQPVSFCFIETPLDDTVAYLQSISKIPIKFDEEAVGDHDAREIGLLQQDSPVPVKQALAWVCFKAGLAYTVRDGKILISTPETLVESRQADEDDTAPDD